MVQRRREREEREREREREREMGESGETRVGASAPTEICSSLNVNLEHKGQWQQTRHRKSIGLGI
jgi:hypothetical protein